MAYAKIENGNVVKVGVCPQNTERTSNFRLLSDEEKKTQGWYKVTDFVYDLKPWESFGTSTYELVNDEVIETKVINTMSLDDYKSNKYNQIKTEGSNFILSKYNQLQQTSALAGFYSEAENTEIVTFCKKYFDIIRSTKEPIMNATTYEEVDLVYFIKNTYAEDMTIISTKFWGE
jgi:hypothetical protein